MNQLGPLVLAQPLLMLSFKNYLLGYGHKYPILYIYYMAAVSTQRQAKELIKLENLDGFLVGKASCDFQELKKIVLSIVEN